MKLSKLERELLESMMKIALGEQFYVGDWKVSRVYDAHFMFKTGKAKTLQSLISKGYVELYYSDQYRLTDQGFKACGYSRDSVIRQMLRREIKRELNVAEVNYQDAYNTFNVHNRSRYSTWSIQSMVELYQGWNEKHPDRPCPSDGLELCFWHYNTMVMQNVENKEERVQRLEHLLARYETRIATLAYALNHQLPLSPDAHTFR